MSVLTRVERRAERRRLVRMTRQAMLARRGLKRIRRELAWCTAMVAKWRAQLSPVERYFYDQRCKATMSDLIFGSSPRHRRYWGLGVPEEPQA